MDSWSSARWISRIAEQYGLPVGGENPGYGLPASLDSFYTNTSSTGMMASAIRIAVACNFKVFYWAHDIHLWDGTLPFSLYTSSIAPYSTATATASATATPTASPTASATATASATGAANLALTGTVTASNTLSGFPASNANDGNQNTYWQAADSTATLTLQLAQAAPIGRIVLELPAELGHPEPDHRGRQQHQRQHLDHPGPLGDLPVHRRQQHRHPLRLPHHRQLPPPRHQRQHRPGRPPDRRVPGLLQLATRPDPARAAQPHAGPPGPSHVARASVRGYGAPLIATVRNY